MSKKALLAAVAIVVVLALIFFLTRSTEPEQTVMTAEEYRSTVDEVRAAYPRFQAGELEPGNIANLKSLCEGILAYDQAKADNKEPHIPAPIVPCEEIMAAPLSGS